MAESKRRTLIVCNRFFSGFETFSCLGLESCRTYQIDQVRNRDKQTTERVTLLWASERHCSLFGNRCLTRGKTPALRDGSPQCHVDRATHSINAQTCRKTWRVQLSPSCLSPVLPLLAETSVYDLDAKDGVSSIPIMWHKTARHVYQDVCEVTIAAPLPAWQSASVDLDQDVQ